MTPYDHLVRHFRSGKRLHVKQFAAKHGVSDRMIWRLLKQLKDQGCVIESRKDSRKVRSSYHHYLVSGLEHLG